MVEKTQASTSTSIPSISFPAESRHAETRTPQDHHRVQQPHSFPGAPLPARRGFGPPDHPLAHRLPAAQSGPNAGLPGIRRGGGGEDGGGASPAAAASAKAEEGIGGFFLFQLQPIFLSGDAADLRQGGLPQQPQRRREEEGVGEGDHDGRAEAVSHRR